MFHVFLLLIVCTVLAYLYSFGVTETVTINGENKIVKKESNLFAKVAFIALATYMILFAGLRTYANDTLIYMNNYQELSTSYAGLDWSLGNNPLFMVYQITIKRFISSNPSAFFLITSFLVILSYILFIKRYSVNFGLSIYILIAFSLYAFTMAALKQTMSIAVAIWTVPAIINKKYFRALLLIAIATLFHAFAFLYLVAFFLTKSVWDKRAVFIIIATIVIGVFFSAFVGSALDFTSSIGGNVYTDEDFVGGTSLLRIVVYFVPSILSFIYRKSIRGENSSFLNMSVNLSLVAACFMALAGIGGANLTGRLAGYFDIFICFSLPATLKYGITSKQTRDIITVIAFIAFAIFYYSYYYKFQQAYPGFFTDYYNHTSLFNVLSNW